MNKAFDFFEWYNLPSMDSPINRANLMKINYGLEEVDNRVIAYDTTKFNTADAQALVKNVVLDEDSGILKIIYYNGTESTYSSLLGKIAVNFDFDEETQKIILYLSDGAPKEIDLSAFITEYEFVDSETIAFPTNENGKVTAVVKKGSITEEYLEPNYLGNVKVEVAKAQSSATAAATSETNAKASENAAQTSRTAAEQSENNAAASAANAANSASTATQKATDAASFANTATTKANEAATSASTAIVKAEEADTSAANAANSASTATQKAANAADSASDAGTYAKEAQSYAVGTDGEVRENDNSDCAKAYYEQTKRISQGLNGMIPMGTITFAELSDPNNQQSGYFFNVSDSFVSDERFKDGTGIFYGAGNNVLRTADGMWDVTAASMVSGVKGDEETEYRQGFVNITKGNIGLGNVANERQYSANNPQPSVTGSSGSCTGNAASATKATQDGNGNNIAQTYLAKTGDAKDTTVTFASGDSTNPTGWANVDVITTGEKLDSLMRKVSLFAKNVRYLWRLLGSTSISGIGNGTVTGAINALNTGLGKTIPTYTSIESLGITSEYIPDIIDAMPNNTAFIMQFGNNSEIYTNVSNKLIGKLDVGAGIFSIEKTTGRYARTIITTNNSGYSSGKIYIGSINTNTKIVNGWYEISGKLLE